MGTDGAQGVFRSPETGAIYARNERGQLCRLGPEAAQTWSPDERHHRLARELARFGLWDHLPEQQRAVAIAETDAGGNPLHTDHVDLLTFVSDGKDLIRGGVERFLAELSPGLERYGVSLQIETIHSPYDAPNDYVVAINGKRCIVWLRPELADDRRWVGWASVAATVRPLVAVNELLADAGSAVRAHTLYAGYDGRVLLLDLRAVEAMRESGLFPDRELPSLPEQLPVAPQ